MFFSKIPGPPKSTLFPYTTLFRSEPFSNRDNRDSCNQGITHDNQKKPGWASGGRSEEHTSELQSHVNLVCRLLLEKKKLLSRGSICSAVTICGYMLLLTGVQSMTL